jgi:hypothetical protein
VLVYQCFSVHQFSLSLKNPELLNFEVLVNHLPSFTVSFFSLFIFCSFYFCLFTHRSLSILSFLLNFPSFFLSVYFCVTYFFCLPLSSVFLRVCVICVACSYLSLLPSSKFQTNYNLSEGLGKHIFVRFHFEVSHF